MLDGITEYSQYSRQFGDEMAFRLNYRNLSNRRSGLERAQTTIARKFLFEDTFYEFPENWTYDQIEIEKIQAAKEAIKAWMGFAYELPACLSDAGKQEFSKIVNWFPAYTYWLLKKTYYDPKQNKQEAGERLFSSDIKLLKSYDARITMEELLKWMKADKTRTADAEDSNTPLKKLADAKQFGDLLLTSKQKSLEHELFDSIIQETSGEDANTYKVVTYETITANAKELGPLSKRIAVCTPKELIPRWKKGKKDYSGEYSDIFLKKKEQGIKKLSEKSTDEDTIIRILCAYLIGKEELKKEASFTGYRLLIKVSVK